MKHLFPLMITLLTTVHLCACSTGNGTSHADPSDTAPRVTTGATVTTEGTVTTEEVTAPPAKVYETVTYDMPKSADHLKVIGRSKELSNGITMDWSGSGVEFNADCTGAITVTIQASKEGKLLCIIDGVASSSYVAVEPGLGTYTLATELSSGPHTVRLIKVTAVESVQPILMSIRSITLTGTLEAPPDDRAYFVEFIGDSITCGFGAASKDDSGTYANLSFGYLLAERLGWDYSFISVSGIGTYKTSERHNGLTIGGVYPYVNYYRSNTEAYQPTRQADLVVIAMNANDNARVVASDKEAYREKVMELLDQIHGFHGENVKVFWLSFNNGLCDGWVRELFTDLGGPACGYYYGTTPRDHDGGGSHPSAAAHVQAANNLEAYLKQHGLMGLS